MCCWTHQERDRADEQDGITFTRAEDGDVRCRCPFGAGCLRRMTQEDWLCDWCRGRDHETACGELNRRLMVRAGDPRVTGHPDH